MDYKVFIIRNNILIYLSRMKSCLLGWSCYHYSLAQRPISHRIHIFLANLSMMQVRHLQTQLINIQLSNRLRVHLVCECGWVSIPGERDLPKSLNWCSRLELRSHAQVRSHARTQASTRTYSLLPWHSNKNKSRCTVIALTKEPSYLSYKDLNALFILQWSKCYKKIVSTKLLYIILICTRAFNSSSEADTTL